MIDISHKMYEKNGAETDTDVDSDGILWLVVVNRLT